jgi:hypothetical protein
MRAPLLSARVHAHCPKRYQILSELEVRSESGGLSGPHAILTKIEAFALR